MSPNIKLATQDDSNFWQQHLFEDEQLLWSGRPGQGLQYSKSGMVMSAIGAVFLVLALFNLRASMAIENTNSFLFLDYMIIAGGLYLLVGHWFLDAEQRKTTHYALTDKRALIYSGFRQMRVRSYPLENAKVTLSGDNPYSVMFGRETRKNDNFSTYKQEVGFRFIDDGREVHDKMQKIAAKTV